MLLIIKTRNGNSHFLAMLFDGLPDVSKMFESDFSMILCIPIGLFQGLDI